MVVRPLQGVHNENIRSAFSRCRPVAVLEQPTQVVVALDLRQGGRAVGTSRKWNHADWPTGDSPNRTTEDGAGHYVCATEFLNPAGRWGGPARRRPKA